MNNRLLCPGRAAMALIPLGFAAILLGFSFVPARASGATGWEPDSTARLLTVDRAGFVPSLDPPMGQVRVSRTRLRDGGEVRFGAGANMNRVDGFSPLLVEEIRNRPWLPNFRSYQSYGTSSHRWSGAGWVWINPGTAALSVGTRWFDETSPWQMPVQATLPGENFLAGVLLREDFSDYLRRRGNETFAAWTPASGRGVQLAWSVEDQISAPRARARLGPFGGDKLFRNNPAIDEGRWHLLRARGIWSFGSARDAWTSQQAHAILAEILASGGRLGTGREFVRLWAEERGRRKLTPYQSFGYRLTWGWTPGGAPVPERDSSRLPRQWQFQAGGIGSLRGHRFQEFRGDRIALATVEYGVDWGRQVQPVLFLDGGKAWNQADHQPGGIGGSGVLALDGGVGLQLGEGPMSARIDVARDLRVERAPARVSLRLGLPY